MITKIYFNVRSWLFIALLAQSSLYIHAMNTADAKKFRQLEKIEEAFKSGRSRSDFLKDEAFTSELLFTAEDLKNALFDHIMHDMQDKLADEHETVILSKINTALKTPFAQDLLNQKINELKFKQHELLVFSDVLELGMKKLNTQLRALLEDTNQRHQAEREIKIGNIKHLLGILSCLNNRFKHAVSPLSSLWSSLSMSGKIGTCAVVGLAVYGTIEAVRKVTATQKNQTKRHTL